MKSATVADIFVLHFFHIAIVVLVFLIFAQFTFYMCPCDILPSHYLPTNATTTAKAASFAKCMCVRVCVCVSGMWAWLSAAIKSSYDMQTGRSATTNCWPKCLLIVTAVRFFFFFLFSYIFWWKFLYLGVCVCARMCFCNLLAVCCLAVARLSDVVGAAGDGRTNTVDTPLCVCVCVLEYVWCCNFKLTLRLLLQPSCHVLQSSRLSIPNILRSFAAVFALNSLRFAISCWLLLLFFLLFLYCVAAASALHCCTSFALSPPLARSHYCLGSRLWLRAFGRPFVSQPFSSR